MIYSGFIFLATFLFTTAVVSNDVKVIDLHKKITLDQLVLEKDKDDEENSDNFTSDIGIVSEDQSVNQEIVTENLNEQDENSDVSAEQIDLVKTEKILDLEKDMLAKHINTITNIRSKTLYREFVKILSSIEIEDENISFDKIYFIIKKLYEIGEIEKAYKIIKKINLNTIDDINNLNFFYFIELNYLFSTLNLEEACELRSLLLKESVTLPKKLLEKTDIFCLTLENNYAEAKLLNSLLLDSEKEVDLNFQNLFNYMSLNKDSEYFFEPLNNIQSKELIFLFTAMLRINELPLNEEFIKIDPLNLSIPVILSNPTDMSIRLKAANNAYNNNLLSVNSLSALYQSVDFSSNQLNNPEETISNISSNELIMAYYYQLANIQIFPNERLNVLIKYWDFAKKNDLEKIAYATSEKILDSFSPASENAKLGIDIAYAHISNNNNSEALKWINLFEMSNLDNEEIKYVRFLLELNKSDNFDTIINFLENGSNFEILNNENISESFSVLNDYLNAQNISKTKSSYLKILDDRLMPSYFLIKDINLKINENKDLSLFILSLVSMYNKSWIELHPEHLKLLLNAYSKYENGKLMKSIILEILSEIKIF